MRNFLCFTILSLSFCHAPLICSSITEGSDYQTLCLNAAKDDATFANFKNHTAFRTVLEHVSASQGREYLKIIEERYPTLLSSIEVCRKNDTIGNPLKSNFGTPYGELSPTTLRYIKVAGDLLDLFGNLKNKKIIEIGGGYGGQCNILSQFTNFTDYTIVDLPEVVSLVKKYLGAFGVKNVSPESKDGFTGKSQYDLVVSNYAFSELSRDEQKFYIDEVLNKSSCGYITCNFISKKFGIQSYTLNELLDILSIPGRSIKILNEEPLTSPGNFILTWSPSKKKSK